MRWPPRKWLVLAAAAGAVGLSALLAAGPFGFRSLISTTQISFEDVRRERFVREVKARGTLKSVDATPITVPTDSQVSQKIAWLATDGQRVKAGDPVVLFDPTEMQKDLTNGQADRKTADNKIGKIDAENRKNSSSLALDVDVVQGEMKQAEGSASKDPQVFSRNEIIESEIDRDLLRKRYDAAGYKKGASTKLGAADKALGEIERSKADMRIRQAEKGLGALRVVAPHDGIVVFQRNWRGEGLSLGETVFPGQKVAEIPDLRVLEARVLVLESDAGGLKSGLPARVTIEGRPGKEYAAKVTRVEAMATTRDWRVPTKYFETVLSLDGADPALMKPGQAVRATIVLEEVPNAIAIPRGAVFEKDGKRLVYRLRSGRFTPVEVTVGRNSLSRVVIEKGLEPGDRIALRDPTRPASEIVRGQDGSPAGAGPGGGGAGGQ